jgi:pyridoxamine 5'-phosphate oxidase
MAQTIDPILLFKEWHQEEVAATEVAIPSACCLSTIGLDGFPNARMVSLKDVVEGRFIVTCPLNSRKAMEIDRHNKVALTFWWPHTERQVRVQGVASWISDNDADRYFAERDQHIQILTWASEQGAPLGSIQELRERYERMKSKLTSPISRPDKWGGFAIGPVRIELMQFRHDRFHERQLFEKADGYWKSIFLQP